MADIDSGLADGTVRAIEDPGGEGIAITTDVSDRQQVQSLVDRVLAHWGRIDILVRNTRAIFPRAPFLEMSDEVWRRVLDVNLYGTFVCSQIVARHMVARGGGGRIVNFASNRGLPPQRQSAHYTASKGGTTNLTRALAVELAPHGITVNAVSPGSDRHSPTAPGHDRGGASTHAPVESRWDASPSRWILPGLIAFLCSDAAAYITGQPIAVNGGTDMA